MLLVLLRRSPNSRHFCFSICSFLKTLATCITSNFSETVSYNFFSIPIISIFSFITPIIAVSCVFFFLFYRTVAFSLMVFIFLTYSFSPLKKLNFVVYWLKVLLFLISSISLFFKRFISLWEAKNWVHIKKYFVFTRTSYIYPNAYLAYLHVLQFGKLIVESFFSQRLLA